MKEGIRTGRLYPYKKRKMFRVQSGALQLLWHTKRQDVIDIVAAGLGHKDRLAAINDLIQPMGVKVSRNTLERFLAERHLLKHARKAAAPVPTATTPTCVCPSCGAALSLVPVLMADKKPEKKKKINEFVQVAGKVAHEMGLPMVLLWKRLHTEFPNGGSKKEKLEWLKTQLQTATR